jgi:predicted TIM-barrel fold metal-dependent hydrolase
MSAPDVIDADGHVTESTEQLAAYIDPAYRDYGPWPGARTYYPTDAGDRSARGTLGETAGGAKAWLETLDRGGERYASDWPHWDHEFPESIAALRGRRDLPAETKQAVLAGTARRLYGLDG